MRLFVSSFTDDTTRRAVQCVSGEKHERRYRSLRGITLIEVLVATFVASVALMALLGTAFASYKINHKARLRDNARAVLRTYVDQFERLAYSDSGNVVRMLFTPTSGPTGLGLRWGQLSDQINYEGAPTTLQIDIGTPGSPQTATVTREVSHVSLTSGDASTTRVADAAGFMLRATFTVTYRLGGSGQQTISQSMTSLRLID